MKKLFSVLLVVVLCAAFPGWAAEKRVALVIGNSAYPDAPLETPANDAQDVASALRELGFEVVEMTDADHEEMRRAIAQFVGKLNAETISLFYFAGHGIQLKGKNYLVPLDAGMGAEPVATRVMVAVDSVLSSLAAGARNIVILDACHSGGLAEVVPPQGTLVALSAAPGKIVPGGKGRNGMYARELLKLLQPPGNTAEKVFKRVRANVAKASGNLQVPWEASSLAGDFYFSPQDEPQYAISSELYRPNIEDEIWKVAHAAGSEAWLNAYLHEFPMGAYASVAKIKLAALKKAARAAQVPGFDGENDEPLAGSVFRDCPECPEMVVIPAGKFQMGSNDDDREQPVHPVTIAKPFALARTEVTQRQWRAIMGNNPSAFEECGNDCPVEQVSWEDAKTFVWKLSTRTGEQYRLPSEAEWEYAARAGSSAKYPWGSDDRNACKYGNVRDRKNFMFNSFDCDDDYGNTAPVARFRANAFGLYDMVGNVWEWVEDCGNVNYDDAPEDGSAWMSGDCNSGVLRGGSWSGKPEGMRAAVRSRIGKAFRINYIGFRVARTLP